MLSILLSTTRLSIGNKLKVYRKSSVEVNNSVIFTIVGDCLLILILVNIRFLRRMTTRVRLHSGWKLNFIKNWEFSTLLAKFHKRFQLNWCVGDGLRERIIFIYKERHNKNCDEMAKSHQSPSSRRWYEWMLTFIHLSLTIWSYRNLIIPSWACSA